MRKLMVLGSALAIMGGCDFGGGLLKSVLWGIEEGVDFWASLSQLGFV